MRWTIRHILCPIDFSIHSRRALRVAAALAQRSNAVLTVAYISDPFLKAAAAASAYDVRQLERQTAKELELLVARARLPVQARCLTLAGAPATTIANVAVKLGADLIVVGSHGLTGARRVFLGSTTADLLLHTKVPVLVVPRKRYSTRQLAAWPGKRVLVAIDLDRYSPGDGRALRAALSAFDATPIFLNVVRRIALPAWLKFAGAEQDGAAATKALQTLARKAGVNAECQVVFGDPADEISAAAASTRAGLVVLKLHPGGITGPRRGSISYKVAARGEAAVLALP